MVSNKLNSDRVTQVDHSKQFLMDREVTNLPTQSLFYISLAVSLTTIWCPVRSLQPNQGCRYLGVLPLGGMIGFYLLPPEHSADTARCRVAPIGRSTQHMIGLDLQLKLTSLVAAKYIGFYPEHIKSTISTLL